MGLFGFGKDKDKKQPKLPTTKFEVTLTFDRRNPKTGLLEHDMSRWGTLWATDGPAAVEIFRAQVRKNEPTLIGFRTQKWKEVPEDKVKSKVKEAPKEPECPSCGADKTCERCDD